MARYSEKFKGRAVARLLAPENAAIDVVAREVGIGSGTLERWRDDRIIITGTLPGVCYAEGMTSFCMQMEFACLTTRALLNRCGIASVSGRRRYPLGNVAATQATSRARNDQEGGAYLSLLPDSSGTLSHRRRLLAYPFQHHPCHGCYPMNSSHDLS